MPGQLHTSILAVALTLLAACTAGTVVAPGWGEPGPSDPADSGPAGPSDVDFEGVILPLLDARCASCHVDPAVAPGFMEGADLRATLLGWPSLVVPGDSTGSTLLTKGAHSGPAWPPAEGLVIADWIDGLAGEDPSGGDPPPDPGVLRTAPTVIVEGPNRLDLGGLGLEGAALTFTALRVALGVHLSDLRLTTAPGNGVRVVHPQLISWVDGSAVPDPEDRFSGVELTIVGGNGAGLASSALLVGFPEGGALSVGFDSVASYAP